jgi:hypothetical protein
MKIQTPKGVFEVPEEFTLRELKLIKTVSGLLPGQMEDALDQGDTGVLCALVLVAAHRSGKPLTEEQVLDWKISDLEFLPEEEETADEEDPS